MTKSKAKSSAIRFGLGNFKLQSKRRSTPRTVRVQSRSCSPVQSLSPTYIPPRSKVAFADFVNLSSDSRILSPRQEKPMTMLNSLASSSQCPSSGGLSNNSSGSHMNSDHQKKCRGKPKVSSSQHCSKQAASSSVPAHDRSLVPCPNERIPTTPVIIAPQAGCSQVPLTGSTPGTSPGTSPSLVHFPGFTSAAACHIQGADVHEPVDKWKFCLVGYVAGKFPGYSAIQSFINRTW